MPRTTLDEHTLAAALLHDYGGHSAKRGSPVWLEWRAADPVPAVREVPETSGLLGRVVDPDWDGAAVVGTGRVRLLDQAHEPPAVLVPGLAGGLTLCCVLSRRGGIGWRMRLPDGTYYDRVPEEGFMLDVLRRSLGQATPPAPASTAAVELAGWLGAVASIGSAAPGRLCWEEILALHPAGATSDVADAADMEASIVAATPIMEWDRMRRLVAGGLQMDGVPPPELADWMDSGMFARWVLDSVPAVAGLLEFVRPYTQPAPHRRLTHLARALDDRTHVR